MALAREPVDRPALLDEACAGDRELRAELQSLLEHHGHASEDFMRPSEADPVLTQFLQDAADVARNRIGERIGGYFIEELIAAGGMGAVYLARQEQPRRHVALKVLRSGIASRSALRRFEFESQILGRLRHPDSVLRHGECAQRPNHHRFRRPQRPEYA